MKISFTFAAAFTEGKKNLKGVSCKPRKKTVIFFLRNKKEYYFCSRF